MSTGRGPMFFSRVAQSPPVTITDVTEHRRHCSQHTAFSASTAHLKKPLLLTFDIFHDHAQVPACLKGAVHGDHKGVFSKGKDVSLHKGLLYLIPQNQVLLVDLFHGEPLLCLLVPNQIHGAVGQTFYQSARGQNWPESSSKLLMKTTWKRREKTENLTRRPRCWWVLSSQSQVHRVYDESAKLCWGSETERGKEGQTPKQIKKRKSTLCCTPAVKNEQVNALANQFLSAYRVVRLWGLCNPTVAAGQLSNFFRNNRQNKDQKKLLVYFKLH